MTCECKYKIVTLFYDLSHNTTLYNAHYQTHMTVLPTMNHTVRSQNIGLLKIRLSWMIVIVLLIAVNALLCDSFIMPGLRHAITVSALNRKDASAASSISGSEEKNILKQVDKWACIKNCGACCKLGPLSSRPDLASYLTKAELKAYQSMISPDDWCKNFDQSTRMCTIYDKRPDFCRVEPKKFKKMYGVEASEFNVSKC